jgi:hypothetical protein
MTNVIRKAIDDALCEAIKPFEGKILGVYFKGLEPLNESVVEVFVQITTPLLDKYWLKYDDWSLVQDEAADLEESLSHQLGGGVEWSDTYRSTGYIFSMIL